MRQAVRSGLAGLGVLALTALAGGGSPAEARSYPWCVFYDPSTYNCGFTSYEQCQRTAFGSGGFCRPNPFESAQPQPKPRRPRQN